MNCWERVLPNKLLLLHALHTPGHLRGMHLLRQLLLLVQLHHYLAFPSPQQTALTGASSLKRRNVMQEVKLPLGVILEGFSRANANVVSAKRLLQHIGRNPMEADGAVDLHTIMFG